MQQVGSVYSISVTPSNAGDSVASFDVLLELPASRTSRRLLQTVAVLHCEYEKDGITTWVKLENATDSQDTSRPVTVTTSEFRQHGRSLWTFGRFEESLTMINLPDASTGQRRANRESAIAVGAIVFAVFIAGIIYMVWKRVLHKHSLHTDTHMGNYRMDLSLPTKKLQINARLNRRSNTAEDMRVF